MTHDYKRHGTSTLFAALNVLTGEVIGECKKHHRHQEFLSFLEKVEAQSDKDKALHVIVDNYSTHKHEKVRNWLKKNPRTAMHFIPTSSSWLNLVERFFGLITEKQIRRGVFSSVKDLEQKIMMFIEAHNANPKPFVWTKKAETILEKIERAKARAGMNTLFVTPHYDRIILWQLHPDVSKSRAGQQIHKQARRRIVTCCPGNLWAKAWLLLQLFLLR